MLTCRHCGTTTPYRGRKREAARALGWSRSKETYACPSCRSDPPAPDPKTRPCDSPNCSAIFTYSGQLRRAVSADPAWAFHGSTWTIWCPDHRG